MSPTLEAETGPRWDRTVPVWAELGSEILCYVMLVVTGMCLPLTVQVQHTTLQTLKVPDSSWVILTSGILSIHMGHGLQPP